MRSGPAHQIIYIIVRFVCIVSFLSQIASAKAQDHEITLLDRESSTNLASEHVTCAAFYAVGARCFAGDKDPTDRNHMQKATVVAMMRAKHYSNLFGATYDDNIASYRSQFDKMAFEIHEDCENLQLLIDRHGKQCEVLMSAPLLRLKQIESKPIK